VAGEDGALDAIVHAFADILVDAGAILTDPVSLAALVDADDLLDLRFTEAVAAFASWPDQTGVDAVLSGSFVDSLSALGGLLATARALKVPDSLPAEIAERALATALARWVRTHSAVSWVALHGLGMLDGARLPFVPIAELIDDPIGHFSTWLRREPQHMTAVLSGIGTEASLVGVSAGALEVPSAALPPGADSWLRFELDLGVGTGAVSLALELTALDGSPDPNAVLIEITAFLSGPLDLGNGWTLATPALGPGGLIVRDDGSLVPVAAPASLRLVKAFASADYTIIDSPKLTIHDPVFEVLLGTDAQVLRLGAKDVRLDVSPDGIVGAILGDTISIGGPIVLEIRPDGVHVAGGVGLKASVPAGGSAGFVSVDHLEVGLLVGADGLTVELSANAGIDLASIVRLKVIGLTGSASIDGSFVVVLGTPSLRGMSIVVDVPDLLVGGGELETGDSEVHGAAALKLTLGDLEVAVGAIFSISEEDGVISFIAAIAATFRPGFQLPLGFELSGLGGVFGFNRTIDVDAARRGFWSGDLTTVLFPAEAVERADTLVPLLRQYFPARHGQYVIGLLARIGWGKPVTLVTATVGVLIEAPDPIRVLLPGSVRVALPKPEAAVVEINADFLGGLDLSSGEVSFLAQIRDSRIAFITLSGGIGFIAGPQGFFLSVGGFHSRFVPPPALAGMPRLKLTIIDTPVLTLSGESFFALTPATVQFGSSFDLRGVFGPVGVRGNLHFEALIRFAPKFAFQVDVGVYVGVTVADVEILAVHADLSVEGPGRWHVKGRIRVKILLVPVSGSVDESWGGSEGAPPPPAVDVAARVRESFGLPSAVDVLPPPVTAAGIDLRPSESGRPMLQPGSTMRVTQRTAPLDLPLERFGTAGIVGASTLSVAAVSIAGQPVGTRPIDGDFIVADYLTMSAADLLSSAPLKAFHAGVEIVPALQFGAVRSDEIDWEEVLDGAPEPALELDFAVATILPPVERLLDVIPAGLVVVDSFSGSPAAEFAEPPARWADAAIGHTEATLAFPWDRPVSV